MRVAPEDLQRLDECHPALVRDDRRVHVREHVHLVHELTENRQHLVHRARGHLLLRVPPQSRVLHVPRRVELGDVGDVQVDKALANALLDGRVVRHPVPDGFHNGLAVRQDEAVDLGAAVILYAFEDVAEMLEETGFVSSEERVRVDGRWQLVPTQEDLVDQP